eukprot:SAG31_NODE_239_length_19453_cov_5.539888_18_plen_394_part_01
MCEVAAYRARSDRLDEAKPGRALLGSYSRLMDKLNEAVNCIKRGASQDADESLGPEVALKSYKEGLALLQMALQDPSELTPQTLSLMRQKQMEVEQRVQKLEQSKGTAVAAQPLLTLVRSKPFDDSVEVLRKATEIDHRLKAGEEQLVEMTLRMYTFGVVLVQKALESRAYDDQPRVVNALNNKLAQVHSRLDSLRGRVADTAALDECLIADRQLIDAGGVPIFTEPDHTRSSEMHIVPSASTMTTTPPPMPPPMPSAQQPLRSPVANAWETGAVYDDVDDIHLNLDHSLTVANVAETAAIPPPMPPMPDAPHETNGSVGGHVVDVGGGKGTAKGTKGVGKSKGGPPAPPAGGSPLDSGEGTAAAAAGRGDLLASINARRIEPTAVGDTSGSVG